MIASSFSGLRGPRLHGERGKFQSANDRVFGFRLAKPTGTQKFMMFQSANDRVFVFRMMPVSWQLPPTRSFNPLMIASSISGQTMQGDYCPAGGVSNR